MTITTQNKIDKEEFINTHWNNLLATIHIEIEEYYKKYRKDFIIFSSIVLFLFCSTIFVMYLSDELTILNIIFTVSACGFFSFLIIFLDMVDFPSYKKWLTKAIFKEKEFQSYNFEKGFKDIYDKIETAYFFNSQDFKKEKKLLYNLSIFEQLKDKEIISISFNEEKNKVINIKYADEDGIIFNLETWIPVKKSIKIKDDEYLLQMTEDGLRFLVPEQNRNGGY